MASSVLLDRLLPCLGIALLGCGGSLAGAGAETGTDSAGGTGSTADSAATSGVPASSTQASDGAVTETQGESETETDTDTDTDTEGETGDPTQSGVCNGDSVCDSGETCASCPGECGSCDVELLPNQRAKYVDETCAVQGDGLADVCAEAAGGSGRYNELQYALGDLVAGDTLYVYPGQYWRAGVEPSDSGGVYSLLEGDGTAQLPIVITAYDRDDMPIVHSCDPNNSSDCPASAVAIDADYVIVDHLEIQGRIQLRGGHASVMQYLTCTQGWGACGDGNWACLRIEGTTDALAHHNNVHSLSGAGIGESCANGETPDIPDRGSGLKEFTADGTIWEFNSVDGPPRWGYDLHRHSLTTTVRFNLFTAITDTAINIQRTQDSRIYGNLMLGSDVGQRTCIAIWGENENLAEQPHSVLIHHNTCVRAEAGLNVSGGPPTTAHDNIIQGLRNIEEPPRNVAIEDPLDLHNNAYDAGGNFRLLSYEPDTWSETLALWQTTTATDVDSQAAAGGVCEFVAPKGDVDLHVAGGVCATMGSEGGQIGAYGVTDCVGHLCP